MLARHARHLINLLDDTPVVPGDVRAGFEEGAAARQILNDAEEDLRGWQPNIEPISSSAGLQKNLMPTNDETNTQQLTSAPGGQSEYGGTNTSDAQYAATGDEQLHPAHRVGEEAPSDRVASGSTGTGAPPYPTSEAESHSAMV